MQVPVVSVPRTFARLCEERAKVRGMDIPLEVFEQQIIS